MLTLHIEADSHQALIDKTFKALGLSLVSKEPAANLASGAIPPAAAETPAAVEPEKAPAAVSSSDTAEPRKRGRPRKVAPAEAPVSAPQAEVGNTVSAPAVSPVAAEGVASAEAAPAASADTFDTMKAALQALAAKDGGQGLREVTAILHSFGYESVKATKDKAEHWGPIAAKAREAM